MKKSKSFILVLLVIFIIISLGLASYILYDKYISQKENNKEVKVTTDKKDDKNINKDKDTDTKSIQEYYVGSKNIVIDETHINTTVEMALFDNNNAILFVDLPEVDSSVYKGSYSMSSDGNISLTFDKKIWNSGDLTDLSPIRNISIKKDDISYIYNLGNDIDLTNEDIYLNKTTDNSVKDSLDNLYSQFENN